MSFTPQFPWFPNVEIYITRNQLFKHIQSSIPFFKGKLLDVGCGVMPYRKFINSNAEISEYIGMDLQNSAVYGHAQPDIFWDGFNIPLDANTVDSVLLTEVLEHCPEPLKVLNDINRVLKVDGTVVFSVPFLWYLHESPWDFYRYTPFAIKKMFQETGFDFEKLEIYGSNDLAFLHSYLIWLKKSALPKLIRFAIYLCTLPFILLFLALAKSKNRNEFNDGQIFIGIIGVAKKIK